MVGMEIGFFLPGPKLVLGRGLSRNSPCLDGLKSIAEFLGRTASGVLLARLVGRQNQVEPSLQWTDGQALADLREIARKLRLGGLGSGFAPVESRQTFSAKFIPRFGHGS